MAQQPHVDLLGLLPNHLIGLNLSEIDRKVVDLYFQLGGHEGEQLLAEGQLWACILVKSEDAPASEVGESKGEFLD